VERVETTWESEILGRGVRMVRWGWYGKPVLLFPTTRGGPEEVEDFGLVGALESLIEAGRVKVFAVGCPEAAVFMDPAAAGSDKSKALADYAQFIATEVAPRIRTDCEDDEIRIATAGANVGAFHAVNAVAKHPALFDIAIGMSGLYDFDRWMGEHFDENYYFNQPIRFVPNLDGDALEAVQDGLFVVATGTGRWEEPDQTRRLAGVLQGKRVPVSMEVWGPDADHDWPTWRTMLPLFLERLA
jgi:esterase/lipase superfamily enzyme